jgi:ABC-type protease/lipase transport system fused ATPase/permease subunit
MQILPSSGGSSRQELKRALVTLWPHFAMAGLFSGAINLLYLSSPLYLMQVYNRVLVSENVPTLILLTVILALALLTMAALDSVRAQLLIRCGVRLEALIARRIFEALVARSARYGYSRGAQQLREFDQFRTFVTGPGIYFAFDLLWIPVYLLLLFFIDPILGMVARSSNGTTRRPRPASDRRPGRRDVLCRPTRGSSCRARRCGRAPRRERQSASWRRDGWRAILCRQG